MDHSWCIVCERFIPPREVPIKNANTSTTKEPLPPPTRKVSPLVPIPHPSTQGAGQSSSRSNQTLGRDTKPVPPTSSRPFVKSPLVITPSALPDDEAEEWQDETTGVKESSKDRPPVGPTLSTSLSSQQLHKRNPQKQQSSNLQTQHQQHFRKGNSKSTSSLVALGQQAANAGHPQRRQASEDKGEKHNRNVAAAAAILPSMAHLTPAQIRALAQQARLEQQKEAANQMAEVESRRRKESERSKAKEMEEEAWTERELALYCSEACRMADRESKDPFSDHRLSSETSSSSIGERSSTGGGMTTNPISSFVDRGRRRSSGAQSEPWTNEDRHNLYPSPAIFPSSAGGLRPSASLVSLASLAHSVSRDLSSPTPSSTTTMTSPGIVGTGGDDSPLGAGAIHRNLSSASLVKQMSLQSNPGTNMPNAATSVLPPLTRKRESLSLLPESFFGSTSGQLGGGGGLNGETSPGFAYPGATHSTAHPHDSHGLHGYAEMMGGKASMIAPRMRRDGSNTSLMSIGSEESGVSHSSVGSYRRHGHDGDLSLGLEHSRVALLPPYQPEGLTFQLGARRNSNSSVSSSNGSGINLSHPNPGTATAAASNATPIGPSSSIPNNVSRSSILGTSPGRGKALAGLRLRPLTPVRAQTMEHLPNGRSILTKEQGQDPLLRFRNERSLSDGGVKSVNPTRSISADASINAKERRTGGDREDQAGGSLSSSLSTSSGRTNRTADLVETIDSSAKKIISPPLETIQSTSPPPPTEMAQPASTSTASGGSPAQPQLQRLGSWGWGLGRILPTLGLTAPLQEVVSTAQTAVNTVVQATGWPTSAYRTVSTGVGGSSQGALPASDSRTASEANQGTSANSSQARISTPSQAEAALQAAAAAAASFHLTHANDPRRRSKASVWV